MKNDVVIIGGGIVGLATAIRLQYYFPDIRVTVCEKEKEVGSHQTGHNSGVIHSGLYYRPGSMKATNCINGYNMLLQFCEEHDIKYDLCGKIVVATKKEEIPTLSMLYERGKENGLKGLKRLSSSEMKEIEPHVNGIEGIWVPQTGIVDYKDVCLKYAEVFQKQGGELLLNCKVKDIQINQSDADVITTTKTITTKITINCAGLYSDKIARITEEKLPFRIIPFRGEYYKLKKEKEYLVKNLIYPVPNPEFPFLGVHFTRMMKGGIEAGPNAVLAFQREGYKKSDINIRELFESLAWPGFQKVAAKYWKTGFGEMYRSFSKNAFTKALQNLLPDITPEDLVEGGSGVRAQACDKDGGLVDDFLILESEFVINVCNAPSPAATSSLSIGEYIANLYLKRFS